ncbi:MAG: 50S ribosomal protein L24 [Candidatus Hodarchaeota archaeon]
MGTKTKTSNPSKQRTNRQNASSFKRNKLVSARLSKDLQRKYKAKRVPVRKGDSVYVTKGDFLGTEGKVLSVDTKKQRLAIDGISREKADKSKIMYPIHTSKVIIRRFGKVDNTRKKILERRAKAQIDIETEDISELEEITAFEEE